MFPEAASTFAGEVDTLYFVWIAVSLFFSVLIAAFIIFFFMKYRRREWYQYGNQAEVKTLPLEITWSVIPLIITLAMFAWGAKVFFDLSRPPVDADAYYAVGKQWMWKFQHPEGVREINDLHVPVGRPIQLTMTSEDVIHSFYVPAFRVKKDVLPGRYTTVWFEATQPGRYHLFCAEYCGTEHSRMIGSVYALSPEDYESWLATGVAGPTLQASGEELFEQFACATCHQVGDGASVDATRLARGPALRGLFGTEVALASGRTVTADESYIRQSILNPQADIVAGWQPIMPTFKGQVTAEQVNALVDFIKSLDGEPAGVPGLGEDLREGAVPALQAATDSVDELEGNRPDAG
ncbi:MAG: cytochrome c oxidase subunit II [Acidobacteriota bacterium]